MKLTLLLLMAITASSITATADQQGHLLTELWGKYEKAVSDDRPKDQLSILEEIKRRAKKEHLTFDFCDAARKFSDVRGSMNWKLRDSLENRLDQELEEFGEPAAMIFASRKCRNADSLDAWIRANTEKLLASSNKTLYANDYRIKNGEFGEILPDLIANDLEYALWCLQHDWSIDENSRKLIADGLSQRYPMNALYEFTEITDNEPEKQELEEYSHKYSGKAAGLLAEQTMLEKRFSDLNEDNGKSSDYMHLLSDCNELSKKADNFSSTEKLVAGICKKWNDSLLQQLNGKEIFAATDDGRLEIQLRNLKSVRVRIFSGEKELLDRTLENPSESFYALDSLEMELPELADGSYHIKLNSGKTEREITHLQYSISIAVKQDREGPAVYAADYISGEPLEWCSLILRDENGNTVAEVPKLDIDGFTRLPQTIAGHFPKLKWNYTLQARYQAPGESERLSREYSLSPYIFRQDSDISTNDDSQDNDAHCLLLTDRSAFNPGETVHFKAILYNGNFVHRLAEEGIALTARLFDPEGNEIDSLEMNTGEFGSAAGSFVLKKSRLGGMYTIRIESLGKTLASARVLADEFVLPTFDLQWEKDERLHLPGDTVEFRGSIKAYSGHSLGSADISYKLTNGPGEIESGSVNTDAEGNFTIRFKSPEEAEYSYCMVTVKVTDMTGETREFSNSAEIQPEIPVEITPVNEASGDIGFKEDPMNPYSRIERHIFTDKTASFLIGTGESTKRPDAEIVYTLSAEEEILAKGTMKPGELSLQLNGSSSGIYKLLVEAKATSDSGQEFSRRDSLLLFSIPDGSSVLSAPGIKSFFLENGADSLSLQMGATCGPVWAVAELYGDGDMLLDRKQVYLAGKAGETGSLETISFPRHDEYPSRLSIKVFYFRDKESYGYTGRFDFRSQESDLPLSFTRFLDTTAPSRSYTFIIRTEAGVECAASIYDASGDTLMKNVWNKVQPWNQYHEEAYIGSICGIDGSPGMSIVLRGSAKGLARTNASVADTAMPMMEFEAAELDEVVVTRAADSAIPAGTSGLSIRKDFESTLAWEPFLRSDENGEIRFEFNTSDKLSLYHVQLFAHDRNFRNNTLSRDLTVTLPVKISILQPQYLYESDFWIARVSVSNMTDQAIRGKAGISFLNGSNVNAAEILKSDGRNISVAAGGTAEFELKLQTPPIDSLGVLASFVPDNGEYGSDAVFVSIPVKKPLQLLTETHSALLLPGADKEALVDSLRNLFTNANGGSATISEISIREMLHEAIPGELCPKSEDVLSLSAALWADAITEALKDPAARRLDAAQKAELTEKIIQCGNSDGGFGWFAGMNSSPAITAVLLERFHEMGAVCPAEISKLLPSAVIYLDKQIFSSGSRPLWCGGLSLEQYLHVRALYPEISVQTEGMGRKDLKTFKKAVRYYLSPEEKAGLNGQIMAKARRLSTLLALLSDDNGTRLARELGISGMTSCRLSKTLGRDVESLSQYAEAHSSGGIYYPNAVMPWRGLLESELYAHTILCRLMEACGHTEIAEGIRLWIMVQKETQQWSNDPGYMEALACVMQGSEKTLDTRAIVLSATRELPFSMIGASGNGFSIEKEFYLDGKKISEGDTLHVGDRLTAIYRIWNGENRSFVKITVPRNAALRPVDQISGNYGWMAKPLRVPGWTSFVPQGYRSVRSDRTEYWFESYPEENTAITEEFFVTQEGRFQSPVPEIESLYAPHYRANGGGAGEVMNVSGK